MKRLETRKEVIVSVYVRHLAFYIIIAAIDGLRPPVDAVRPFGRATVAAVLSL